MDMRRKKIIKVLTIFIKTNILFLSGTEVPEKTYIILSREVKGLAL